MSSHAVAVDRQVVADALLRCGPWYCTHDDEALVSHARQQAVAVARIVATEGRAEAYHRGRDRAERHHIEPPAGSPRAVVARLCCEYWWRRQLRRLNVRRLEQRARVLGRVHKRAGIYVSHETYRARRQQQTRNSRLLESITATNQHGQEYTLAELAELSLANPDHRRAELMLRIADTEAEARRLGHVGMFYTLTCPSRFHPVRSRPNVHPNPKYDGSTPREAQAHLQGVWSRIRAKLGRDDLGVYGIRVVEPHHDGTPHWHLLLWMRPEDAGPVSRVMHDYATRADADELRSRYARKARFDAKRIDYRRGTAAGYVAKYISKNINGQQFAEVDHYGHDMQTSAPRIESWASCWGIRQFQFVGLPSVTVWRECRRLKDETALADWEACTRPEPEAAAILADLRRACIGGQWDKFLRLMGGPMAPRQAQPVRPWRVVRQDAAGQLADEETGEVTFNALGRYGEPMPATWGLVVTSAQGEAEYLTRLYRWEIERKGEPALDLEGLAFDAEGGAWTGVNNCTPLGRIRLEREARQAIRPGRFREFRFMGVAKPKRPLWPWERSILFERGASESFRRMFPTADPDIAERLRAENARDLWHYQIEGEKRRAAAAEDRRRAALVEQGRDLIIRMLAHGELSLSDINPEVLTA